MGWLILAVYIVMIIPAFQSIASSCRYSFTSLWKDQDERDRLISSSFMFALFWPFTWPVFMAMLGFHGYKYK